ncbi:MAG: hypothetical protein A3D35_00600 [Candidatus Staskawiczbacteria bacterium RIFCSPHIGHO2_02_FULL_34_9]|uniref:DUF3467 domain-containing protein n=1 Tax=Candidatus Staskawiczbacteria bacterium RIFCSPHIGHO2_02_FULL_34_9 TaxID=1802206 RepID=A0A1G2I3C2_9BACT|nr:MAG: hypothetical protein A3D35_00600 [Candidatus Staskawiczbacteria bacterium RIFCSPHIGHO2_02_FULL_34_9]
MEKETQQQININVDPNIYFITMVNMMFNEDSFNFLITSGNQGRQFVADPKHAKRICLLLEKQIKEYEKQFGEIKTQLPETPKTSQEQESKLGF